MRPLILMIIVLLVVSCKKEINNLVHPEYVKNARSDLKDRLSASDFTNLDFKNAVVYSVDSVQLYILRIPLKAREIMSDFVIVRTNIEGNIQEGRIVHLEGHQVEYGEGKIKNKTWEGNISVSSLDRKTELNSRVSNGYVVAWHPQMNLRTAMVQPIYPDPYVILPEVVVVAYETVNGGISFSDWMLLQSFFNNNTSGGSSGYYGSIDGGGGDYGGSTGGYEGVAGGSHGGSIQTGTTVLIDYDYQYNNPAIDLNKYLKCFTNIPDAGSSCSIEILTDIPVDSDPNKFFDWSNGSPGHTFLQIKKSNGTKSAVENIGFYPKSGWKTALTPAPVAGKFVDNGGHEYNASLKMNITPAQLQSVITEIQYLAKFVKYDIDEYNCTDWALEVFNYVRSPANQLTISKFDLPGAQAPNGTSMPQGLYLKLQEMKKNKSPEANNIDMGFIKGFVASSTGPCN